MIEVDVKVPVGQNISMIVKRNIQEVFLQSPGAFAVGGGWAKMRLVNSEIVGSNVKRETYNLPFTDFDGLAMIGISTGDANTSRDKAAFVLAISQNATHKQVSYSSPSLDVSLVGNFANGAYRGKVNWEPSHLENAYKGIIARSGERALIKSQMKEPFYWAAAYLNSAEGIPDHGVNPVYERKRGVSSVTGRSLSPTPIIELTTMPVVDKDAYYIPAYEDNASDNGFRLGEVVSGIEIFKFKDEDGQIRFGFADVLIGKADNSDEMIKYMLEQANQMEAVAQSIRIVAEAKLVKQKGLM